MLSKIAYFSNQFVIYVHEFGCFCLQHADENDCIRAFGGPRPYRYVCEDNLELSSNNTQPLELDEDFNHQEWKWDAERGRYNATAEMKVSLDGVLLCITHHTL